jgi:hypothetical protein
MTDTDAYSFRLREQEVPPPARRITDVAVMRHEGVYEVDPRLMQQVPQQPFPNWDTLRIAHGREDHLAWMHRHWARPVISGQTVLDEISTKEEHA